MWEWRGTPGGGRSRAKRQGDEAHSGLGFAVKWQDGGQSSNQNNRVF